MLDMTRWVAVGVWVWAVGCGGEVIVESDRLHLSEDGAGGRGGGSASACVACAEGDCGLCAGMAEASHRCEDEVPPASNCRQLGSLFSEGGEHYVCWACD